MRSSEAEIPAQRGALPWLLRCEARDASEARKGHALAGILLVNSLWVVGSHFIQMAFPSERARSTWDALGQLVGIVFSFLCAFILNRRGHSKAAAGFIIITQTAALFIAPTFDPPPAFIAAVYPLTLAFPVLISGVMLSVRGMVAYTTALCFGVVLFYSYGGGFHLRKAIESEDGSGYMLIFWSISLYMSAAGMIWISAWLTRQAQKDADELRQQELLRRAEAENARRASENKSRFLASMSHELRTPLNAVIGYSELLMEEVQDAPEDVVYGDLHKINTAASQLLDLINNILDLSKIEAGQMILNHEPIPLKPFVDNIQAIAKSLTDKKHNTLIVDCPGDQDVFEADRLRVRQILLNLLGNAAKFTENGTITFKAGRKEKEGRADIYFEVRDTGIGMSASQIEDLFKDYKQASTAIAEHFGGTGLGLVISMRLAQLMGGEIFVESEPGKGSCFRLVLPAVIGHA